jgi:hypothetical protein
MGFKVSVAESLINAIMAKASLMAERLVKVAPRTDKTLGD